MTKYYCPKCDKRLSKSEVEGIFCSNCGKVTHIDTESIKHATAEDAKKRKQKYAIVVAIAAGSLIVATIGLYSYLSTPSFYQYSMECKKFVENGTMPILDANLTLTKSQIEGNATQECMSYGNDTYCYRVGMNENPQSTDTAWSCDVLSVIPVSNYTGNTLQAAEQP
ncbi:MAG: hypothetical protein KGH86_00625 [Thaumarchaeota archaeon]|nr:hypothetical protein [Nitrososphaerota archaeon]MDE1818097.1 hypothetical protein [Nitrososphaerota archaeon]MDE1875320.1 hypothetical protein [Nitrososphaerota archaeon]